MKKRLALGLCMVFAAVMITGCNSGTASSAVNSGTATSSGVTATTKEGGKTFGVTYWIESDFFKTVGESIKKQAEADGNKVIIVDAQQDSAKQIQIIEDFITQGVDAVFLNPVDREAIAPALQKLEEANIPVINFDSSVANLDLVDAYVATDNVQAGQLCGEALIADFPEGGDIAVLNYKSNSACNDREQGFLDTIEGHGFNIVATFDAQGTVEKGQTITSDILQANPNIVAIFGINDQCGMGAFAAAKTAGKEVAIYGVDGAPEAKQAIALNDIYKMTAAQSPITIGKECYTVAMDILAGKTPAEFQIDVPSFTIDQKNISQYLNEGWQ